ncbi:MULTISPECIES: MSCRAMM family adhesin SdrC [Halorussus]|uniref:MSCRAMM family adhesin SdrC n=1 Tax=Halorussus TaxID=1070314 RepID=UPI00209E5BA3|nr:MSCRAMM family adhesin SdrC [Halorussus vallis]USZ74370.1 MSCRAMM family adhesin SdrC [Halorussus vallis]
MQLDCRCDARDGVTLVELVVENDAAVARRVRIGNRLDGTVWPPRCEGVPEAGWDDGGFEGVVAPGERLAVGYASPAGPRDPPAEIVWTERAARDPDASSERVSAPERDTDARPETGADSISVGAVAATPESVVRSLGDPRPPADAVPLAAPEARSDSTEKRDRPNQDDESDGETDRDDPNESDIDSGGDSTEVPAAAGTSVDDAHPEPVDAWLSAAERRIERVKSLAAATTLDEAAAELEALGGLAAAEDMLAVVADDRERLLAVAERAAELGDRAAAAEAVPLDAYRRLS